MFYMSLPSESLYIINRSALELLSQLCVAVASVTGCFDS